MLSAQIPIGITTLADAEPAPAGSLRAAILSANQRASEASAQNPLVLTFASNLQNGSVMLANNLPELTADHVVLTVAGTSTSRRVTFDCTGADAALLVSGDFLRCEFMRFHKGGARHGNGDTVMLLGASDAVFSHCDFTDGQEAGVNLIAARRARFSDCLFANNGKLFGPGILCHDSSDWMLVERSTFRDHPGSAVALAGVQGTWFRDCRFERNLAGVVVSEFCRELRFGPNNVLRDHSDFGLVAVNAIGLRIEQCDFAATTNGIAMAAVVDSRGTVVLGNQFTPGNAPALLIERSQDTEVTGNRMSGNGSGTIGLQLLDAPRTRLFANDVRGFRSDGFKAVGCENLLVGPGNLAARNGGRGFSLEGRNGKLARITVQSSAAINNGPGTAGFLLLDADATLVNVTAAGNAVGLSVHGQSRADVANGIFADNTSLDRHIAAGSVTMVYSAYRSSQGSFGGGSGNYVGSGSGFARFVGLGSDDVHLRSDSPLIDRGTNVPPGGLPAADLDLEQRVRRGGSQLDVTDFGADEWSAPSPDGTSLVVVGGAVRGVSNQLVPLQLDASSQRAGHPYVLLLGCSGTSPGVRLSGVPLIALQPDALTYAFLSHPGALGQLDGSGRATHVIWLPGDLFAMAGIELTAVFATFDLAFASNPVGIRFLQ